MTHGTHSLRLATPADADGCLAIYGPFIAETAISFETDVPTASEFGSRIASVLRSYPWIVAIGADEGIGGYAYGSEHRGRSAYQWSVEVSAYVHPDAHRSGLGRRMYEALFTCLRAQGFHNAYAGMTLPNDASIGFHAAMGFTEVGVYDRIGFKHGAWRSVRWAQKRLLESEGEPVPPRLLPTCREEVASILTRG